MSNSINRILASARVSSKYGARMGARDIAPESPLYVQRLRMVDWDYDPSGVYCGGWSRQHGGMFCGFNADGARVYVRAHTRAHALQLIRETYPDVKFYRG